MDWFKNFEFLQHNWSVQPQIQGGQLVTNVVIGEDSGFQILSSKDEEAEREKPRKVISTKVHKKKIKSIHDHR